MPILPSLGFVMTLLFRFLLTLMGCLFSFLTQIKLVLWFYA